MTQNTNTQDAAIQSQIDMLVFRIATLTIAVQEDTASILAAANVLQRDVESGFICKHNTNVDARIQSYIRNATEIESLSQFLQILKHIQKAEAQQ